MTGWTDGMAANGWQRVWKITHVDGTTHDGYQWPLPTNGRRRVVKATSIEPRNTYACPVREGDGLCVVRTGIVRHVTSGGIRLACCIGLDMRTRAEWILGHDNNEKLRVSQVDVLGLFRPLEIIRSGAIKDLAGADLAGAYLAGADLAGADLAGADLYGADLYGANLSWANLAGADLYRANLTGADLAGADLAGADLYGANLTRAAASASTVWPDGFDHAAAGVVNL